MGLDILFGNSSGKTASLHILMMLTDNPDHIILKHPGTFKYFSAFIRVFPISGKFAAFKTFPWSFDYPVIHTSQANIVEESCNQNRVFDLPEKMTS